MFDTARLARPQQAAPTFVDADLVRRHLALLASRGIGYKRAAELAGLSTESVRVIVAGRRGSTRGGELPTRVTARVARPLLAVVADEPDPYLVPALGARRRVQALTLLGWTQTRLAERLHVDAQAVGRVLRSKQIKSTLHWALVALFDELWDLPAPALTAHDRAAATRVAATARALKWQPALAWDDIDNDDEPGTGEPVDIDDLAVDLAVDGERHVRLTYAERRPAIAALNGRRFTDGMIADRLGLHIDKVGQIRRALALPAVLDPEAHS